MTPDLQSHILDDLRWLHRHSKRRAQGPGSGRRRRLDAIDLNFVRRFGRV